ncbi:PaaI family thioesterase [Extensimonas sp. H3M7-6]|uniref:PaaI family thioesterase n=1 Tax=Extensimonas soli TaxID=3031322 RepID=UPI0023DCA9F7|nr:PaaI family thioesterase [Extensimonas sp. H3M7-6]MDF1483276.1 PaaI family thioesterase [Extensimonas sp. H3M7-6]
MSGIPVDVPFVQHLGFVVRRMENGESEVYFDVRPEHMNSFAVAHGGATMTLLDVAMATAARSQTPELGVVTIEMKTSFMQAGRGALLAKGRVLHRTARMAFVEGTVYDATGRACSHATGTFKFVPRQPPAGEQSAQPVIYTD